MNTPKQLADLFAAPPPRRFKTLATSSIYLPMRDGIQLAVDVLLPAPLPDDARLGAVMIMARYWRSMELRFPDQPGKAPQGPREKIADDLLARGFAVVMVDARGTGASTGVCRMPWAPEEIADYAEVARWITGQPWSNGAIGATGISYEGATALRLASAGLPSVKGVIAQEIEYDVYEDIVMPGGILNANFISMWSDSNNSLDNHRPSKLFPLAARWMIKGPRPADSERATRAVLQQALAEHQANTDVLQALGGVTFRDDPFGTVGATLPDFSVQAVQADINASQAAIFSWGSWMDGASAHAALRTLHSSSRPQIVVIGAWKHEMTAHGSPYVAPGSPPDSAQQSVWAAQAQFLNAALNEGGLPPGKTVFYNVLGTETWKQADTFPPPNVTQQPWHFQANGGLAPTPGPEGSDRYTVDIQATTGAKNRWQTQFARPVVYGNRAAQDRRLLTYTSAPLERDLEIAGFPLITLHVASTLADACFFAYLEEVDEGGYVRYLTEGQLRAMHRKLAPEAGPVWSGWPARTFARADAAPLVPGQMAEIVFGLQPVAALIRRGRRLRVALAGADRDTFALFPAEGVPVWQVGRGGAAQSQITLPVVSG